MNTVTRDWEPRFVLGETTRKNIEARVAAVVAEWLSEWGLLESAASLACVVRDTHAIRSLAFAMRLGFFYVAKWSEDDALTFVLPEAWMESLLMPDRHGGRRLNSSRHSPAPIAEAVEMELIRSLAVQISGHSAADLRLSNHVGSATEWLARTEKAQCVVAEIGIASKTVLVVLPPQLVRAWTPEGGRGHSTLSPLRRRSDGIADLKVRIQGRLPPVELTLADIAQLEVGDVMLFRSDADKKMQLAVNFEPFANGALGRTNESRAISISGLIDHPS